MGVFHMVIWRLGFLISAVSQRFELSVSRTPGYQGGNISRTLRVSINTQPKKTQTIPLIKKGKLTAREKEEGAPALFCCQEYLLPNFLP